MDAGGDGLSKREQLPDLVGLAEVHLVSDQQRLQRLLDGLLGVESGGVVRGHLGAEDNTGDEQVLLGLGQPLVHEVPPRSLRRSRRG